MTCARRLADAQRPASSTHSPAPPGSPSRPDPLSGCSSARLFLLPVLALLLGALSLFHAAPATAAAPSAPTDLALPSSQVTVFSFDVTWTASTSTGADAPTYHEVAFDVATRTVSNLRYTARIISGTTITINSDSSDLTIEEATQYRATIRACNAACSAYAGDVTVWTEIRSPANIATVDVMQGNAQLRLSWTTVDPFAGQVAPTGYAVAYTASTTVDEDANVGTEPTTEWVDAGHSGRAKLHTITGLTNGQEYRVRVGALNVVNGQEQGGQITGFGKGTPGSSDADLFGLTASASTSASGTFSALTLSPLTFAAATLAYTATVPNATTHVKLTPTVNDSTATVEVGKGSSLSEVTSGSASAAIALAAGDNTITVKVTASNGWTTQSYTVTVTRSALQIAFSAIPNPVDEGESVTVTVTLGSAPASDLVVPVTLTAGTAESGDYGALTSITVSAGQTTGTGTITTTLDTDPDDETFTVAFDRDAVAILGYALEPGDPYWHRILIKDLSELELEITYGDPSNPKLLIGPYGKLGEADGRVRNVQASPTMKRLSLKLSWVDGAIPGDPTAVVYYYMPGVAGDTLTWGAGQNGTTKTLEMYSPLGTPGYPKVTLSSRDEDDEIEYTIIFQNNVAWEFHHNNLLDRLQMTIPQGQ